MSETPSWRTKLARMIAPPASPAQATDAKARVTAGVTPLAALQLPADAFWLPGNPAADGGAGSDVRGLAAYGAISLAYICMRYRATKLTEARLWIADETDDGEEWLEDGHELEQLLEQPNPDMSHGELWELVSLYLDIDGACLLVKTRDSVGRLASLYPFPRDQFVVEPADGRLYGRFRVTQLDGRPSDWLTPDDVIFLREVDPGNLWGAVSVTDAALGDLNLSLRQRNTVRALFKNSMMPGSITTVPGNLSDEQYERWRTQFAPQYTGVANAGKNILVEGAAKWEQVKVSLKEMDYGTLADRIEASVCAAYGLHPVMVGLYASSAMSGGLADSIGPATEQFYDRVLFPRWERTAEKLTQGLLRGETGTDRDNLRRYVRWDTSAVRALQEDIGEKVTTAAAATFWTTNEKRAYTGKTPTTDPADDELQRSPAPVPPGGDGGGGNGNDKEDPDAAPQKGAARISGSAPGSGSGLAQKAMPEVTEDDIAWMLFDAVATSHELSIRLAAAEMLDQDRSVLTALVTGAERKERARPLTPEEIEAIEAAAVAYLAGDSAARWRERMSSPLRLVAEGAVQRVAASVGIGFDVLQEGLLDYVEREAAWLVTEISETTRDGIRRALRDALEAGDSIPDMARRIGDAAAFNNERATLIARTESTRVMNGAQTEQLTGYGKRSGRKVRKTWLSSPPDGRNRPHHLAMNGETRDIDETYSNGRSHPDEPNCRCTQTFHVEEAV